MSSLCTCPAMPELGPRDPIPTGPVVCVCCGHPLELTCTGKCNRVAESIAAAAKASHPGTALFAESAPAGNIELTGRAKETKRRVFSDRVCACGATFTPHWTGAKQCPACVAAKAVV
jgi:hypothetical protein